MGTISGTLASLRTWIASWFTAKNRDSLLVVLDHVSAFVDLAMPIVAAIDRELKPQLKTGNLAATMAVEDFMRKYMDAEHYDAIAKRAQIVSYMPLPDLLINVAQFMLQGAKPDSLSASILRLAIELAYNVYKGSKDNAKTKVS